MHRNFHHNQTLIENTWRTFCHAYAEFWPYMQIDIVINILQINPKNYLILQVGVGT